jgi:hypothetical protein
VIDALAALLIAIPAPADLPKCEPGYTHEVPGHPPCQIDWGNQPDIKMGPAAPPGWVPGPTPKNSPEPPPNLLPPGAGCYWCHG